MGIRMRHLRDHSGPMSTRPEAHEIILINSHDGASSYQLMCGMFRHICCNGLVVGDVAHDIRIKHQGNVQGEVIEGAFRVLDDFQAVDESTEAIKAIELKPKRRGRLPGRHWRCATVNAAKASHRRRSPPNS